MLKNLSVAIFTVITIKNELRAINMISQYIKLLLLLRTFYQKILTQTEEPSYKKNVVVSKDNL